MTSVTVVMPLGPGRPREFVIDTVASLREYLPGARYVLLDDTGTGLGDELGLERATVLRNSSEPGRLGALYRWISRGLEEALSEPFDVLLRIDEDAVVLGDSWVERARAAFEADPHLGLLGNHAHEYDGQRRLYLHSRKRLRQMLATPAAVRDPARTARIGSLFVRARRNGYLVGEQVLSGVSLWNPAAVRALRDAGLLGDRHLMRTAMTEDAIFGLALRAAGFSMAQFGDAYDDLPIGARWRGLPASPDELVAAGKELVHSTKSFAGRDEAEVRARFRAAREADAGHGTSPAGGSVG